MESQKERLVIEVLQDDIILQNSLDIVKRLTDNPKVTSILVTFLPKSMKDYKVFMDIFFNDAQIRSEVYSIVEDLLFTTNVRADIIISCEQS